MTGVLMSKGEDSQKPARQKEEGRVTAEAETEVTQLHAMELQQLPETTKVGRDRKNSSLGPSEGDRP